MKNIEMTVEGDKLTIIINLSKNYGPSKSGKTTIIASTEGNQIIPTEDSRQIVLGLNLYQK